MSWRPIKDKIIQHRWRCVEYGELHAHQLIPPDWYQQNEPPVCSDCGKKMEYVETMLDCGFDPLRETLVIKQERETK